MNDVADSQIDSTEDSLEDDEQVAKQRLQELKKARNQMLEDIPAPLGGAGSETRVLAGGEIAENLSNPKATQSILNSEQAEGRKEVTAATIGRMLGLVTLSEFKLVESKVDLISTRMNGVLNRMDKIIGILEAAPTGSDLDRIDVQIGALKTILKDALTEFQGSKVEQSEERVADARILSNDE
jgi:hypothetical protein